MGVLELDCTTTKGLNVCHTHKKRHVQLMQDSNCSCNRGQNCSLILSRPCFCFPGDDGVHRLETGDTRDAQPDGDCYSGDCSCDDGSGSYGDGIIHKMSTMHLR